jgi:hypothetical protein
MTQGNKLIDLLGDDEEDDDVSTSPVNGFVNSDAVSLCQYLRLWSPWRAGHCARLERVSGTAERKCSRNQSRIIQHRYVLNQQ